MEFIEKLIKYKNYERFYPEETLIYEFFRGIFQNLIMNDKFSNINKYLKEKIYIFMMICAIY